MRLALLSTWTYLQSKTRSKRSVKASPIPATVPNSRHQSQNDPHEPHFVWYLSLIPVSVPLPLWVRVRVRFMNKVSSVLFPFLLGPSLNLCLFYKSSMRYPLHRHLGLGPVQYGVCDFIYLCHSVWVEQCGMTGAYSNKITTKTTTTVKSSFCFSISSYEAQVMPSYVY